VIASHDPALIERVCTRKLHLEHGRIVSDVQVERKIDDVQTSSPEIDADVIAA